MIGGYFKNNFQNKSSKFPLHLVHKNQTLYHHHDGFEIQNKIQQKVKKLLWVKIKVGWQQQHRPLRLQSPNSLF